MSASFSLTDDLRSWGRAPRGPTRLAQPRFQDEIPDLLAAARREHLSCLAAGFGRSYGDSGLNLHQATIAMAGLDRVLAFDPSTGVLRAEAGISLGEVIRRVAPHGWFLPTTPGTRFVTLGGAVANDVHGKNHHHMGTFGTNVRRIGLLRSDLGAVEVGPGDNAGLFPATVGGLGLTGVILWVEIQLTPIRSCFLDSERISFGDLEEFRQIAAESTEGFEHTVSWIDCATATREKVRGVFNRANWRDDGRFVLHDDRQRLSLPFDLPGFALNPLTLRAFNEVYYRLQSAPPKQRTEHYTATFYPLDAIGRWNGLYGRRGFFQHQCVTPEEAGVEPIGEMLAAISAAGEGSFLAVLKTFGPKPSPGLLSFPRPGFTLALDFANRGTRTYQLLARLDDIVAAAGGRIYPAKDGCMSPALFAAGYPQLDRFRAAIDPSFSSSFWRRVADD